MQMQSGRHCRRDPDAQQCRSCLIPPPGTDGSYSGAPVNLKPLTWGPAAVAAAVTLALTACTGSPAHTLYEPATAAAAAPSATAPAASPVSTQATLTGQCTTGLLDETAHDFYPTEAALPQGDTAAEAYQMALTNNRTTVAEVTGFSAVFYDTSGDETTSDTEGFVSPVFLEPDQSLTWTEEPWGSYTVGPSAGGPPGPYTAGTTGAMDLGTCQLVQWTHP